MQEVTAAPTRSPHASDTGARAGALGGAQHSHAVAVGGRCGPRGASRPLPRGLVVAHRQRRDGINTCGSEASKVASVKGDTGAAIAWHGGGKCSRGHEALWPSASLQRPTRALFGRSALT